MTAAPLPDPEILRQLLRYDARSGLLFWKRRPREMFTTWRACCVWNARYADNEALGCKHTGGKGGSIFDRKAKAHRSVWALAHGYWPKVIDHIDGDPHNNRLENLREVEQRINSRNCKLGKNNSSGRVGVRLRKDTGRWSARITVDRRDIALGTFDTFEAACAARATAEPLYGFHPNHGRAA